MKRAIIFVAAVLLAAFGVASAGIYNMGELD